jgi:uncharacterized protein DUF4159
VSRFVFATARYESGDWESAPALPEAVLDALVRYTTIDAAPVGVDVDVSTDAVFDYPFVWLTGHLPVRFTDEERRHLKRYVERGGFLMVDDHNHDITGIFHKTATEEITRTFGAMTRVPNNDPLYTCFFSYPEGPPNTQQELNGWGDDLIHRYLDCIRVEGRIGLLYSSKDYSSEWNFHAETKQFMQLDPTKFAVNLIVYALTR